MSASWSAIISRARTFRSSEVPAPRASARSAWLASSADEKALKLAVFFGGVLVTAYLRRSGSCQTLSRTLLEIGVQYCQSGDERFGCKWKA
jgi:hypothetical protein